MNFSPDDIFSAVSGVTTSMYEKKIAISTPSANSGSIPFGNDLPAPRATGGKGNGPVPPSKFVDRKGNDPVYDDEPSESLKDDPPPAYKANVACDVIDKTLNSEMGQTALQAEIQNLGNSAASVEVCFRNVARGLEKTLEAATTKSQISEMQKFQQTWDKHHKTYIKLLWNSRRVAGHARVIATDFAGDFLDVIKQEKYSLEQKKKEIANYREELERDKANSQELSQGFLDLQTAVVMFQSELQQYAKRAEKLRQDIERLTKDIEKIRVQLSKVTKQALMTAVATLGLGAAAAGALAVGALCPPLFIGAAYGALKTYKSGQQCLNSYKEQRAVAKNLNEKKQILADYQKALEGLEKIATILSTLDTDMVFIQEKLGVFAQIWVFIHADLNEIEKLLERTSQAEIQEYFEKKIKAVSTVYMSLSRALYWYETNTHIQELHTLAQF